MFGKLTAVISVLTLALICAGGATVEGTGVSPAAGVLSQIGTAFTYQGQLLGSGAPVNDTCDFEFSLWDAAGSGTPPVGGNLVGSPQPALNIPVNNGLFAVRLDFGSGVFAGEARWLQTAVRCPAGSGAYTTLAPRQALTPVPYAMLSEDLSLPFDKWTSSPDNAFSVGNSGEGPAGVFGIDNPANDSAALKGHSWGTGAALGAWAWNDADAFWANVHGTGDVARLHIDNPDNTGTVVNASTNGLGAGAGFSIDNPLNSHSALWASTNGSGQAGGFSTSGSGNAVSATTSGSGTALYAATSGLGNVVFLSADNPDHAGQVIQAVTYGIGSVAHFRTVNPLNSQPTIAAMTVGSTSAGFFKTDGSGAAVHATTSGSGWAGSFDATGSGNGVYISTPAGTTGLTVSGGSKNAVVATSEGARLLYSEESSAVWFTDYGFGRLADGSVFIPVDPLFAETVNLDEPYHVFVQAYGDAELYVSQRTPAGFEVRLRAGDPEVEFSYRLVAARRGYEGKRLERAPWADGDPNLYPAQPAAPQKGGAE